MDGLPFFPVDFPGIGGEQFVKMRECPTGEMPAPGGEARCAVLRVKGGFGREIAWQ